MTKYFKAECGGGVALRSSKSRTYSHAVMREGANVAWAFSGRRDLAEKVKADTEKRTGKAYQIVEVTEVDAKEYRQLKELQRAS